MPKTCTLCEIEKPLREFYKQADTPDGKTYYCKRCLADTKKARRDRKRREREEKLYGGNTLLRTLLVVHKLTREEADWWLDQWRGYCPICGDEIDNPVVDHCHESLEVRGIICYRCNTGLGMARDDVEILSNMIDYLGG